MSTKGVDEDGFYTRDLAGFKACELLSPSLLSDTQLSLGCDIHGFAVPKPTQETGEDGKVTVTIFCRSSPHDTHQSLSLTVPPPSLSCSVAPDRQDGQTFMGKLS